MERLEDEKSKNPIQVADRIFQVLESLARGGATRWDSTKALSTGC